MSGGGRVVVSSSGMRVVAVVLSGINSEWQSWSALYMLVSIGFRKPSLCWRTFSCTVPHNHNGSFLFPGVGRSLQCPQRQSSKAEWSARGLKPATWA